jgi:hypothetical protein
VSAKLAQMQLLAAENEVLQAREAVLHSAIAANDREMSLLQQQAPGGGGPLPSAGSGSSADGPARAGSVTSRPRAAAAAPSAGSPPGDGEGSGSCEADCAAAAAGGGEGGSDAWQPPPRSPAMEDFIARYRVYIRDVLDNRMGPDGSVAPAPNGDVRPGAALGGGRVAPGHGRLGPAARCPPPPSPCPMPPHPPPTRRCASLRRAIWCMRS